jgi:hypothetical protein
MKFLVRYLWIPFNNRYLKEHGRSASEEDKERRQLENLQTGGVQGLEICPNMQVRP